jgi:hypothetical protein
LYPEIVQQTENEIAKLGGAISRDQATDLMNVNDEFTISIVLARCQIRVDRINQWNLRFDTSLAPDITVAVRLDSTNLAALDYYLLPRLDFGPSKIRLIDRNPIEFECYRFDNLDYLHRMAERTRIRRREA